MRVAWGNSRFKRLACSRDVPLCSLPCEQGRVGEGLNTLR
jgi:hypothetical protein